MSDVRPAPFFVGDSAALDFLNSIAAPRSTEFEWLANGADVLDWLVQSGLLSEEELAALRRPEHQAALDLEAPEIRAFREEFRSFVATASKAGKVSTTDPMIERLNGLISQGEQLLRLVHNPAADGGLGLKLEHRLQTADDILPFIASVCAELVAEADFTYVRKCQGTGCKLFFRDVSKNRKRRWCSMEVCGNRAKAAAYRKRA